MTEVYDAWTADNDISKLLSSYGLFTTDPTLQLLIEIAVGNTFENYEVRKKIGKTLQKTPSELRKPIRDLANAVESKDWNTVGPGTDPVIASDGTHHKGLSHLQSFPDNTA